MKHIWYNKEYQYFPRDGNAASCSLVQVITFPPFEGTERHYLHAQIARIAAATSVSPQGFFTFGSGEEEADLDMEEGMGLYQQSSCIY